MSGNVYVIEDYRRPRDQVYVIVYQAGKPTLALHRVREIEPESPQSRNRSMIKIPNDKNGGAEMFTFETGI